MEAINLIENTLWSDKEYFLEYVKEIWNEMCSIPNSQSSYN